MPAEEETCGRKWCDENDKNKMLNISTTTDDNIFNALSHNQDKPVTMSRRSPEDQLRDDRALGGYESSTVDEKRDELRVRKEAIIRKSKNATEMVQELVEQEDEGSVLQHLLKDGELRAADVMRAAQVLEALGINSEDDLDILATAFFDAMADAGDLSAVMVFKLWKTLHRSVHIPTEEDRYGRKGHGVPSYPATRAIMEKLAMTKRQWEHRQQPTSTKTNVVNDGWTSPAERTGT